MDAEFPSDGIALTSPSREDTERLGWLIGQSVGADAVVALDGEMGAGKTTLVRGIAAGLGVTEPVSSPTYTLMHSYPGRLELFHFDAWMEGREAAFLDGGGAEWFHQGGVSVVEWASRVRAYLPADRLELQLLHQGAPQFDEEGLLDERQERGVRLRALGPASQLLLEALVDRIHADGRLQVAP